MSRAPHHYSAVLAFALAAAAAPAQSMSVTPGTSLTPGSTAKIAYSNPSKANQTITVLVVGGFPVPTIQEVVIELDAKGNGQGSWVVSSTWRNATFSAPGVTDIGIPII